MTPKTRRRLFALVPVLALVVLAEICTRVVCVGDSVTFGNSFDDSWPGRLQRRLNDAEPGRFVVFNAATPGHNVVQCKRLLQSRWIDLAPDVVVWLEKSRFADRVELPEPIDHGRTAALEQIYRFRALYLLTAAAQAWSARRADPVARAFDSSLAPATGAQPNVLPELARWCGERGVRAFVALAYLEHEGDEIRTLEGDFDETARVKYDTAPARLLFANSLSAFRAHPGGAAALFTDRIHLTGEGADLVAATAAQAVLALVGEAP